ncbi:MAG: hypothetical protein KU38_13115 [Sulfurovum sp. FS08-3]|nr:MAG: hypothetical protein KU38_13115 [Sulfurovum sp. FS08-3]
MGTIEDKIKLDLMQTIFNDSSAIFEFIENRFKLNDEQKKDIVTKINTCNNDLYQILKDVKLV